MKRKTFILFLIISMFLLSSCESAGEHGPSADTPTLPADGDDVALTDAPTLPADGDDEPSADAPTLPADGDDEPSADTPTLPADREGEPLTDTPTLPADGEGEPLTDAPTLPADGDDEASADAPTLPADIEYTAVTVDGVTRIDTETGKGIELDLNGDGTAEQIYICQEGIYINGELSADLWHWSLGAHFQPWDFYWITDIDTADQYYNLILHNNLDSVETMAWYDGSLHMENLSNFNGCSFSEAEYHQDGTFIVDSYPVPLPYQSCYRPVEFRWSAETGIERIPKEVELHKSCTWTLLTVLSLYRSADFESETVTISAQEVQLKEILFDDDWLYCWIHLSGLEDGTEGWIYTERIENNQWIVNFDKDAQEIFEGFSTAG